MRKAAVTGTMGLLALALVASPAGAFALFAPATGSPQDAALQARRWDDNGGPLAEDGPGLGGGLEYAVAADFCAQLATSASGELTCTQVTTALEEAMTSWERLTSQVRFEALAVAPRLETEGDTSLRPRGAEIDFFAVTSHPRLIQTGTEATAAATMTRTEGAQGLTLTNGTRGTGPRVLATDVVLRVDPDCGTAGHVACWTPDRLRTVLAHELGHVLGLEHPFDGRRLALDSGAPCEEPAQGVRDTGSQAPSVMSYESEGDRTSAPSVDDSLALRVLYPPCTAAFSSFPWFIVAAGGVGLLVVAGGALAFVLAAHKRRAGQRP